MALLIALTASVIIICGLLHLVWKLWISWFPFSSCLPTLPWIGSALYLERKPHKLYNQILSLMESNNYFLSFWMGHKPIIFSGCVETAEIILSCPENITKSDFYWNFHEWLGTGLLTSKGTKWKKRRRQITPAFHFTTLNTFTNIFKEHSIGLVDYFQSFADTGEAIDIQIPVSLAALDIICETSMGVKVNALKDAQSSYIQAVSSMNGYLQERQRSPWLWPKLLYCLTSSGRQYYKNLKVLQDFTTSVINDRIKSRTESAGIVEEFPNTKKVFLDILLDLYDKGGIDIDGIREEVDTFMFEGHDTTAAGLGWILYLLGQYPNVQKKLHEEIDNVSKNSGSVLDKICEMKYLEYVIKEGLRLHPPVALYGRELEKDTLINGKLVAKGANIGIFALGLHTNPAYWDEPLKFNPDRFGDEKFLKRNPYIYVPFSAGPRNCVGQKFALREEKILLYHILLTYRIESIQNIEDIKACFEIIHRSNNGLMMKLFTR